MSRKPLVAANWKMNKTIAEGRAYAESLAGSLHELAGVDVVVFPSYLALPAVAGGLNGTAAVCGAQDVSSEKGGAFTGEVSATMIRDAGATHVLVGHSERRHVLGEDDALVGKKLVAAFDEGLTVVLCVGETLDERESGQAEARVRGQLESALGDVPADRLSGLVLAYEPVWAIGTGRTATPGDAQAMHAAIRDWMATRFGDGPAGNVRILYGGSVKPDNAGALMAEPDIDGALIGGASLDVDSFVAIARAAL